MRSTNCGYNWTNVKNNLPEDIKLISIYGLNASIILVAGYKDSVTYVYRTSNSVQNWIHVFSQVNGFINAIYIIRNSNRIKKIEEILNRPIQNNRVFSLFNDGINYYDGDVIITDLEAFKRRNGITDKTLFIVFRPATETD